jgi:hypothetical protein
MVAGRRPKSLAVIPGRAKREPQMRDCASGNLEIPGLPRNDGRSVHGFFTMGKLLLQANIAVSEISAWLKTLDQLHPTGNRR